ncbi:MAG: putative toxin-antitoxin system toxin component, PIN family [Firmicutes bacterium]|nr:putative toxin-antitoxin system toxin component, PIN family [Bacillota bacterium]
MIKIVIDTNVIISSALSPTGNPAKVVQLIDKKDKVQFFYTEKIFAEYTRVLSYGHLKIYPEEKEYILNRVLNFGILTNPPISTIAMPDETDRIFYDAAKAAKAILITGNLKHYPKLPFIMPPIEFITQLLI